MFGLSGYVRLLVLILVFGLVGAGCGGKSTAGKPPDPAAVNFQIAAVTFQEQVVAAGIPDADRDFAFCLGPADPVPLATAVPDPSGHSRARVFCLEAAAKVIQVLPRYQELITGLEKSTPAEVKEPRVRAGFEALKKAHQARLQLYQDVAAAAARKDSEALARLRLRYDEVNALSEDLAKKLATLAQPPK